MFKGGRGAARSEPTVRRALPKTGALVGGLTWTGFPPGLRPCFQGWGPPSRVGEAPAPDAGSGAGAGRFQQVQGARGGAGALPGPSDRFLTSVSPTEPHSSGGAGESSAPGKAGVHPRPLPARTRATAPGRVTVTSSRGLRERPECPPLLPVTSVEVSAPLSEGDPLLLRDLGHSLWEKLGFPGDGVSAGGCTGRGQERDLTSDWRHREGSGSLQRAPHPDPCPPSHSPPPCGFRVLHPQQT